MYKISSDRRQQVMHRGRLVDWINGEERLKAEDQYAQLKAGMATLEERRAKETDPDERHQIGMQIKLHGERINQFKKAFGIVKKAERSVEFLFVAMAKEILLKSQYETIWKAALNEQELRKKALNDLPAPDPEIKFERRPWRQK